MWVEVTRRHGRRPAAAHCEEDLAGAGSILTNARAGLLTVPAGGGLVVTLIFDLEALSDVTQQRPSLNILVP